MTFLSDLSRIFNDDLFAFSKSEVGKLFKLGPKARERVYIQITNNSNEEFSFYLLTILATVVISLGLIINNGAVVIGGMIIAPVIWPILTLAISVSLGRVTTVRKSFFNIIKASIIVFIVAALVGYVSPFDSFREEILSRTEPTFIELLIGLAAGMVGAYAVSSVRVSSTIGGVAVAVALVPPLCVAGLTLATGNYSQVVGAFLLYSANLLAIIVGSLLVFVLEGFFVSTTDANESARKSYVLWSLSLLIVISIPLLALTQSLVGENRTRNFVLQMTKEMYPNSKVTDLTIKNTEYNLVVDMVLQKEKGEDNADLEKLSKIYSTKFKKPVTLNLSFIELNKKTVTNYSP
ncbi:TIGR00341 family protein [candidate division WWE3 bacterium CG10_big_fil_rev_8_21_14_0_10_32_10]|uniref:TIGR00341 family protein n=1 Tax=candidate division WWE3 bacterium CG10_big_fil_rev_8_21_14_0_10_32_10 TaxID=1975090 RepID=A0A2H0RB04_UNCKA|nr:MAG: TIGR00341 family protein [candidate division WWE3 bacterium CG10_big_fil_rev_8_21_14_0_10_32_10]